MKKYNKYALYFICVSYVLLTLIELVKYLLTSRNLFGLIYLLISSVIVFLLVPTTINYKDKFSLARVSKLLLVILIGLFSSFILGLVLINNLKYVDSSSEYMNSIFVIKNILKPIVYAIIVYVIVIDCDLINKVKKLIKKIEMK